MGTWPVQDAKAKFSELLEVAETSGPQTITRRGVEKAVIVPIEQWRRLTGDRSPLCWRSFSRVLSSICRSRREDGGR